MPFCTKCGHQNAENAQFCQSCGAEIRPSQQTFAATRGYGGFWIRVVAAIIDWIVGYAVAGVFAMVTLGIGAIFVIFIPWLYEALMTSSEKRATLGKMAFGLTVTDLNGNRITFWRATGRHFAKILSGLILFVGYVMVAFTEKKQGLHDMIAGTVVVQR